MKLPIWKRLALWLGVIDHPGEPTWFPVWLHSAGAVPVVLVQIALGVQPIIAVIVNAGLWTGREMLQARGLGKSINPRSWSPRKFAELVVPIAVGGLMAGIAPALLKTIGW